MFIFSPRASIKKVPYFKNDFNLKYLAALHFTIYKCF